MQKSFHIRAEQLPLIQRSGERGVSVAVLSTDFYSCSVIESRMKFALLYG